MRKIIKLVLIFNLIIQNFAYSKAIEKEVDSTIVVTQTSIGLPDNDFMRDRIMKIFYIKEKFLLQIV